MPCEHQDKPLIPVCGNIRASGIKPDRFLQLSIPSAHKLFRMIEPDLKSIRLEILEPPDDLVERLR
jgi:hypothetical protein